MPCYSPDSVSIGTDPISGGDMRATVQILSVDADTCPYDWVGPGWNMSQEDSGMILEAAIYLFLLAWSVKLIIGVILNKHA